MRITFFVIGAVLLLGLAAQDPNCQATGSNGMCLICSLNYFVRQGRCVTIPNCQTVNAFNQTCFVCNSGFFVAADGQCQPGTGSGAARGTVTTTMSTMGSGGGSGQGMMGTIGSIGGTGSSFSSSSGSLQNFSSSSSSSSLSSSSSNLATTGLTTTTTTTRIDPNCLTSLPSGTCLQCASNFYLSQGICRQVSPNCQAWDNFTGSCTSCVSGYSLIGGACVLTPNSAAFQGVQNFQSQFLPVGPVVPAVNTGGWVSETTRMTTTSGGSTGGAAATTTSFSSPGSTQGSFVTGFGGGQVITPNPGSNLTIIINPIGGGSNTFTSGTTQTTTTTQTFRPLPSSPFLTPSVGSILPFNIVNFIIQQVNQYNRQNSQQSELIIIDANGRRIQGGTTNDISGPIYFVTMNNQQLTPAMINYITSLIANLRTSNSNQNFNLAGGSTTQTTTTTTTTTGENSNSISFQRLSTANNSPIPASYLQAIYLKLQTINANKPFAEQIVLVRPDNSVIPTTFTTSEPSPIFFRFNDGRALTADVRLALDRLVRELNEGEFGGGSSGTRVVEVVTTTTTTTTEEERRLQRLEAERLQREETERRLRLERLQRE
jgi:hypothetical protein